jgi:hypothetical protein
MTYLIVIQYDRCDRGPLGTPTHPPNEPLLTGIRLVDPALVLPEVESLRLTSTIMYPSFTLPYRGDYSYLTLHI